MEETIDSREQFIDMSDTKPGPSPPQLDDDQIDMSWTATKATLTASSKIPVPYIGLAVSPFS